MFEDLFNGIDTAEVQDIKIRKYDIARYAFIRNKSLTTTPAGKDIGANIWFLSTLVLSK